MSVFTDDVADAPIVALLPYSLERSGVIWLGSGVYLAPRLPKALGKQPVALHQHGVSVEDVDAYTALLADVAE